MRNIVLFFSVIVLFSALCPTVQAKSTIWQIGTPEGAITPAWKGALEYNTNDYVYDSNGFDYYVEEDDNPVNDPNMPGIIGNIKVCDIVSDGRPCVDATPVLNIYFNIDCGCEDVNLVYDRYGSETDILYLDGVEFAQVSGQEGKYSHFTFDLGALDAGEHILTILYGGAGDNNGHYIDYIKLEGNCSKCFDLCAGQNMPVGTVKVIAEGNDLIVTYMVDENYKILETHLAVGGSLGDIPQTKKDNPIPGQFNDVNENHDYLSEVTYIVDVSAHKESTVYIAAHAIVAWAVEACYAQVWQIGDIEEILAYEGWLSNYADEFNWGLPASPNTPGPSLAVEKPAYDNPFIVGVSSTKMFPFNSNKSANYATNFDVQWYGTLPFGGKLTLSWSPGAVGSEKKVVTDDGTTGIFTAQGENRPGEGWFLDKYPLVENYMMLGSESMGTHTINFQHTSGDGTYWDWIILERPCEEWETAWGDGCDGTSFPGKNWATYFTFYVPAE